MIGQQHAVGGQCNVIDSRNAGQVTDQISEVGAQQWLAAREAYLAHAQPGNSLVRRTISSKDNRSRDFRN